MKCSWEESFGKNLDRLNQSEATIKKIESSTNVSLLIQFMLFLRMPVTIEYN